MSFSIVFFLIFFCFYCVKADHLIVLVHGFLGSPTDLEYLGEQLTKLGNCRVLYSQSNFWIKSLAGIEDGAQRLVDEIQIAQQNHPNLRQISFVGNSLGGLYARFATHLMTAHLRLNGNCTNNVTESSDCKYLYANSNALGFEPISFLTVASPFLGVSDYTYLDDLVQHIAGAESAKIPVTVKKMIASIMGSTGKELFLFDDKDKTQTLLYRMNTAEEYLAPLRLFKRRRLYANLDNDFMVSAYTGAFLAPETIIFLQERERQSRTTTPSSKKEASVADLPRIVANITTSPNLHCSISTNESQANAQTVESFGQGLSAAADSSNSPPEAADPKQAVYSRMRDKLDCLGWEKVIVYFPGNLPLAHNRIAALRKFPTFISRMLGFDQGNFVMDHAAEFLSRGEHSAAQTASCTVEICSQYPETALVNDA